MKRRRRVAAPGAATGVHQHYEGQGRSELSMGWVDPWVGLGRVGSGMGRKFVFLVGWVGSWV